MTQRIDYITHRVRSVFESGNSIGIYGQNNTHLERKFGNGVIRYFDKLPAAGFPRTVHVLLCLVRIGHSEAHHIEKENKHTIVRVVQERELTEILTSCTDLLQSVRSGKQVIAADLLTSSDVEKPPTAIMTGDEAYETAWLEILTQVSPCRILERMITERRWKMEGLDLTQQSVSGLAFVVAKSRSRKETRDAELQKFAPAFETAMAQSSMPGMVHKNLMSEICRTVLGRLYDGRQLVAREWVEPVILNGCIKPSYYRPGKKMLELLVSYSPALPVDLFERARQRIGRRPVLEAMMTEYEQALADGKSKLSDAFEVAIAELRRKYEEQLSALTSEIGAKAAKVHKELAQLPALEQAVQLIVATGIEVEV
ncbi:MAG: hypothetical protein JWN18_334 [Parcubacteria group bacterium]|nr:hypothetical protein [Parcubacteria group bacterium]